MGYSTEHIVCALKKARETKGLSQRKLGKKAGVPQSHISKIENGKVDLRASSLIEIARVLDLELVLVSRRVLPAVESIARVDAASVSSDLGYPKPLYSLSEEDED